MAGHLLGARAFDFCMICQDSSESECITFLSNTTEAMDKDYSRFFVSDYIVPKTGV